MSLDIFIHAAILPQCGERLLQYLDYITSSGLFEQVQHVFICFVGTYYPNILSWPVFQKYNYKFKIRLVSVSENLQDYELPTLQYMYEYCLLHPECKVLYLHTKNVGKEINLCIEDQVAYMLYFLVNKWRECVDKLENGYDTCGVDLRDNPVLHYSGNFWWSTAKHIITDLPEPNEYNSLERYPNPLNSLRHNQEFWICSNTANIKPCSLWDCGINCYERHLHRYPKEMYTN